MVVVTSEDEIDSKSTRELIELIWKLFGVAVDYVSDRDDVIKVLRSLAQ